MCLVLFAFHADPRYTLVLAANRDEFHARPTRPAAWIEPAVLAGLDLQAGGTWLALRRDGRFSVLTNFRDPSRQLPGAPSRGSLPLRIVHDPRPLPHALPELTRDLAGYNGCNLLAGSTDSMYSLSNRAEGLLQVAPGVHGLSNHLLDSPWPKVVRGKAGLAAWLATDGEDLEALFDLLGDRQVAADADLPHTGMTLEWERRLSAAFVLSPDYGTRCSTVLVLSREGTARLIERSFDPDGQARGEVTFTFHVSLPAV